MIARYLKLGGTKVIHSFLFTLLCIQKGGIPASCSKILECCRDELIADKTRETRKKLCAYRDILETTWALYSKTDTIKGFVDILSQIHLARRQLYEANLSSLSEGKIIKIYWSVCNYVYILYIATQISP